MGPLLGGLSAAGAASHELRDARRWRDRLEHAWGVTVHDVAERTALDPRRLFTELERGLWLIDFPEVTVEDRVTFLEHAVAWQVRRALTAGRFDLALDIQAWGAERVAGLQEQRDGWRPVLLYGVPRPDRPLRNARPTS